MATFKVGQRVRVINANSDPTKPGIPAPETLGCEGVIVAHGWGGWDWIMHVDGFGTRQLSVMSEDIAPLTNPKADEHFARFMRKVREPLPAGHIASDGGLALHVTNNEIKGGDSK